MWRKWVLVDPGKLCPPKAKRCVVRSSRNRETLLVDMNCIRASQPERPPEARCELCPLNRVKAGVAVRIKQLCAAPETQHRLRELGFCEDHIIKLLTSQANFICQVCDARLAISEQLAKLILVEPVQPAWAKV